MKRAAPKVCVFSCWDKLRFRGESYVLCSGLCGCIEVYAMGVGEGVSKEIYGTVRRQYDVTSRVSDFQNGEQSGVFLKRRAKKEDLRPKTPWSKTNTPWTKTKTPRTKTKTQWTKTPGWGGGAPGYFLGRYVPPGTPNCPPRSKKNSP